MNSKKILILGAALGVLVLAGLVGRGVIYAQDADGYPLIIQKLVARFNLDANEVQEVFDEVRGERHQAMQIRFEERLNQAVEEGKITPEQKEAILAKKAEMIKRHEELRNLSWEEKRATMTDLRGEMKTWAEENGIDLDSFYLGGLKGHRGFRFGPGLGQ